MDFYSLFTERETFKEVQVALFIVGHTHKAIDGQFSYLSKKI